MELFFTNHSQIATEHPEAGCIKFDDCSELSEVGLGDMVSKKVWSMHWIFEMLLNLVKSPKD